MTVAWPKIAAHNSLAFSDAIKQWEDRFTLCISRTHSTDPCKLLASCGSLARMQHNRRYPLRYPMHSDGAGRNGLHQSAVRSFLAYYPYKEPHTRA